MKKLKTLPEVIKYVKEIKEKNSNSYSPYGSTDNNISYSKVIDFGSIKNYSKDELKEFDEFLVGDYSTEHDTVSYYSQRLSCSLGAFIALSGFSTLSLNDLSFFDKIIRDESASDKLRFALLKNCLYTSPSIIDELITSNSKSVLQHVAATCSISKLDLLRKHKWAEIRNIAYSRLGPVEYLDDMLLDKSKNVRMRGLDICPPFYKTLSKLANERAGWLVQLIALKMPVKDLPYLLGNKIFQDASKSRWMSKRVAKIISFRMEQNSALNKELK